MEQKQSTGHLSDVSLETLEKIGRNMPGGFFVYKAYGKEELIYANEVVCDIFGCDDIDEFKELTGFTFPGMVHEGDLERIENSIIQQVKEHSRKLDYVEYRIRRKDGEIRWMDDYGRLVHTAEYGDVFYVLIRDITEIHDMREMLTETDYLTELFNRRHFDRELLRNFSQILHLGGRLALIMLDIDKFHDFNETYGHLIGDRCLSQVATTMRKALHRQNDLPFRYGGEEFAVLLPGANLERAAEVAEDIRLAVRDIGIPHKTGPCDVVTISAGVAVLDSEEARCVANPSAELIRLADAALYEAKNAGRDTVRTRSIQFSLLR